ncbi:MAG: tRNA (adenosine(37)-N6)-dimethylallyltransferase MiaA [Deltaproteobacteria bacterium]
MEGDPLADCIVLCGPTASGKSALAVALAQRIGAEIIGVDSQQVYRGLPIGTAQPSPEELAAVPHRLVGFVEPPDEMTAARWAELARSAAAEIRSRGRRVLLCGGTGLYLRAALKGLFRGPAANPELRAALLGEAERVGRAALHARLGEVDPVAAARLAPNDLVRVIRALEVHAATGRPLSEHFERQAREAVRAHWLGLAPPRDELAGRIEARTRRLFERGLLDEARWLRERGLEGWAPARALGYRDALAHLRGELGLAEAMARTSHETRRYAKRQLTWFRAIPEVLWLPWPAPVEAALEALAGRALS